MKTKLGLFFAGLCVYTTVDAALLRSLASAPRVKQAVAGMVLGGSSIAMQDVRSRFYKPCPAALKFTTDPHGVLVVKGMEQLRESGVKVVDTVDGQGIRSVTLSLAHPTAVFAELVLDGACTFPDEAETQVKEYASVTQKCSGQNKNTLKLGSVGGKLYIEQIHGANHQTKKPSALHIVNHSRRGGLVDRIVQWWYRE